MNLCIFKMSGLYPLAFFIGFTLMLFSTETTGARLYLRPLSADEVYRVLRESGREDAVPQGRIVTQGISAIAGFTLGLVKGIGGAALVGALSGAGLGLASIAAQSANSNSGGSSSSSGSTTLQMQEICFNSRSLEDDENLGAETGTGTETATGAETGTGTGTGRQATTATTALTSPTTTGTIDDTPSGTTLTTMTGGGGGGGSTNCIVVQKPVSG